MPKYTFTKVKEKENQFDCSDVAMEVDTVDLHTLLEEFRLFLLACGYQVPGQIVVEEEDDNI